MNHLLIVFVSLIILQAVNLSFAETANETGKKIYDAKCAMCHGTDGKGKPAMAKAFKLPLSAFDLTIPATTNKKDEELSKIIADGKNKMPGYAKQLKPEELKSVLQYTRVLGIKKSQDKPTKK